MKSLLTVTIAVILFAACLNTTTKTPSDTTVVKTDTTIIKHDTTTHKTITDTSVDTN